MPDTDSLEETIFSPLVKRSQAGDRGAFDSLVKRYYVCAMKTAVRVLANADDATEAVQEGFVAAYLKIKKLKDPQRFGPWLLQIMVHCAIDRQKAITRRKQLLRKADNPSCAESYHDNLSSTNDLQSAIGSAMGKLTKVQAKAIALFGIEELSHQETAEALGCSPQAVRWHVHQARKKLKVLLKEYLE